MFTALRTIAARLLLAETIALGSGLIAVAALTLLGAPEMTALGLGACVRCVAWFVVVVRD